MMIEIKAREGEQKDKKMGPKKMYFTRSANIKKYKTTVAQHLEFFHSMLGCLVACKKMICLCSGWPTSKQ